MSPCSRMSRRVSAPMGRLSRKRKGAGPETRSPFLPLPGRGQRSPALVLTIIDIFANESRLPVRLFSE